MRIPHSGESGLAGFRGRIPRATLNFSAGDTRPVGFAPEPRSRGHPIHNTTHDMHHHRVGAGVVVPPNRAFALRNGEPQHPHPAPSP